MTISGGKVCDHPLSPDELELRKVKSLAACHTACEWWSRIQARPVLTACSFSTPPWPPWSFEMLSILQWTQKAIPCPLRDTRISSQPTAQPPTALRVYFLCSAMHWTPSVEGTYNSPFPSVQTFPTCPSVTSPGLEAEDPEMSLNLPQELMV